VSAPALVGVAHGSRNRAAGEHIAALLADVAACRPGLSVRPAYVELTPPSLPEALAHLDRRAVVVPLLLGRGHHVGVDVPTGAASRPGTVVTAPFGPDPVLAGVLAQRLRAARADDCAAVVLAAAGSSDAAGAEDTRLMAGWLAAELAVPVRVGYASAARPTVTEAVSALRAGGADRVAVASYLLAPGHFADRLRGAGADVVSAPLSPHPVLAEVVLRRYDAAPVA
jgi:sirohydrochlorin ferrochelatase